MKRKIIVAVSVALPLLVLYVVIIYARMIPTGIVTQGCMVILKQQIEKYEKEHGELPYSLEPFRRFNKNSDITKDEWGNQIIYAVDSEQSITLKSLGRDAKPGGRGRNSDITLRFQTGDAVVMPFESGRTN